MAKKTYRTYYLKKLFTFVRDEAGNKIPIVFRGGIQVDSTSRFTTSNPLIQKGLEAASGFNRDYYLESVVEDKPAPSPVKEEAPKAKEEEKVLPKEFIDSRSFRNLVEMKDAMKAAGLKIDEGWNYTQTKKFAAEKGYDYKISKAEK